MNKVKVFAMYLPQYHETEVNNKFCIFIKTVINVVFMKNIPIFYVSKLINFTKFEIL